LEGISRGDEERPVSQEEPKKWGLWYQKDGFRKETTAILSPNQSSITS
jgi:hypothetical protein